MKTKYPELFSIRVLKSIPSWGQGVVVELKSIEKLSPAHFKQIQTYLKVARKKLGLLINFNESLLKDGYKRVVNDLDG